MSTLVDTEQLKSVTGYERPGDIERCLRKNGIPFFCGKKGPVTTMDAINVALGVPLNQVHGNDDDGFEFL